MHEYSIVLSLLDQVADEAGRHEAQAVRSVRVRVGELSGVEPDLIRSAFEIARAGTVCEGADLDLVVVKARWTCPRCGGNIDQPAELVCPECGVPARLAAGDDLILERLLLEVA
ncbi:MAG: hydrogenase maturation nickel metallochaperone HypA [Polyangiaceae bacterium]|nr:hydrogenase maturation nickel metallochaperone HypA [Polyangiaceae bacterium]